MKVRGRRGEGEQVLSEPRNWRQQADMPSRPPHNEVPSSPLIKKALPIS